MPESPRPQDVDATKPVVDADPTTAPTPQGRTDRDAPAGDAFDDGLDADETEAA